MQKNAVEGASGHTTTTYGKWNMIYNVSYGTYLLCTVLLHEAIYQWDIYAAMYMKFMCVLKYKGLLCSYFYMVNCEKSKK